MTAGADAAFRPSPVFLALLAVTGGAGALLWTGAGGPTAAGPLAFGFVVSGWLVSLCLHEFAHAVVAYRAGDASVAGRGYLTLNPLRYSHPLLSIVLPVAVVVLGGIGLPGGAVWVDRHAIPGRLRHTLVSAAGPATNVLFAVALASVVPAGSARAPFWAAVALSAYLQLTASLLNLLPVPGLDGGNMIQPWLPERWRRGYDLVAPFGFLVLFGLLLDDRIGGWFFGAVFAIGEAVGLPGWRYAEGLDLIRFWS